MNNLEDYIKESIAKNRKHYFVFDNITVSIKDLLPDNIDLEVLFNIINQKIPYNFINNIDGVYIGQFDILNDREVNALYHEGAIYITNLQDDNEDMLDDIVHEIGHSVEEKYPHDIYGDKQIELEFLGKRKRLDSLLSTQDFDTVEYDFEQTEYSPELDSFFYQEVGYPLLTTISRGLFVSPYGATSLREYFSNGFEEFYLGNRDYLKQVSPKLFDKIYLVHQIGE